MKPRAGFGNKKQQTRRDRVEEVTGNGDRRECSQGLLVWVGLLAVVVLVDVLVAVVGWKRMAEEGGC